MLGSYQPYRYKVSFNVLQKCLILGLTSLKFPVLCLFLLAFSSALQTPQLVCSLIKVERVPQPSTGVRLQPVIDLGSGPGAVADKVPTWKVVMVENIGAWIPFPEISAVETIRLLTCSLTYIVPLLPGS